MSSHINDALRSLVASRADYLCEYCLIGEDGTFFGCQVDHIISLKHGGPTVPENLAYACSYCNRHKGSDIASISDAGNLVRFFNPRIDIWSEHFRLEGVRILPFTEIGEVTTRILRFNDSERVLEREALMDVGHYPREAGQIRIEKHNPESA